MQQEAVMLDPDLEKLFDVPFTFSKNCVSGIVNHLPPGSRCECWRCRKERGEPVDEASEQLAEQQRKVAKAAFNQSMREFWSRNT